MLRLWISTITYHGRDSTLSARQIIIAASMHHIHGDAFVAIVVLVAAAAFLLLSPSHALATASFAAKLAQS